MYFEVKKYTKAGYDYNGKIKEHDGYASLSVFFKRFESNNHEKEIEQIIELIKKIDENSNSDLRL